ncbi:MAG: hypothetical protein MRY74_10935 [Neomegalonema sp.]|nr:hypothetical protein [Neomegalonema sp.]
MSTFRAFCTFCELLIEDVSALSPYNMAIIVGFGKFGGYDETYLEIRADVLQCAELFQVVRPELDLSDLFEPLSMQLRRDLDEPALTKERDRLHRGLHRMLTEARHMGELRYTQGWAVVEQSQRAAFEARLTEAGLGALLRSATTPTATASRDRPIFLSSSFEAELAGQIVPALRQVGLRPISAAADAVPSNGEAWDTLRRQIAACRGGVLRLCENHFERQESEIREALKHFPDRVVIVAEPRSLQRPLPDISIRALFPVVGDAMDPAEAQRFSDLIATHL